jgi:hypothetical protein
MSGDFNFRVKRFQINPIIHRQMDGMEGEIGCNINGPSLIRVPDWIEKPLGKYYLYFAHHHGEFIRMAYADNLEGPWRCLHGGVMSVEETIAYEGRPRDHVASPDVHVDHENRRVIMYYHTPSPTDGPEGQGSYVALSQDGLNFKSLPEYLGLSYFRVFQCNDWYYALAKYHNDGGIMYRSRDGFSDFETGRRILPRVRHMAVWLHEGDLYVFYSRGGDAPEHIMVSRVSHLDADWADWEFSEPKVVIKPEKDYEGVAMPIKPSRWGAGYEFLHELRDPAIYEEDGRLYLLYSTAGEWAIAIAELFFESDCH